MSDTTTQHTPGPWHVHSLGVHHNNPDLEHLEVCWSEHDECVCDTVYTKPDARLIASAPDLLSALKELRRARTDKSETMADAAIAKAAGGV